MTISDDESLLARVAERLTVKTGLRFSASRLHDLERGLKSAAREMGFDDWQPFARWLVEAELARKEIETLASHLTIGETYFLRDPQVFEIFEKSILPEVALSRRSGERRLRIWSAGCATGEEPYSIAITVRRAIPDWKHWNITILATEIDGRFLQKAGKGVYREWSFRSCPQEVKRLCFAETLEGFEILPDIREMVSFDYLNLAEDVYPSLATGTNAMDVIFCRNVLMYFDPEISRRVIERFHRCLVEGGWLIVSAPDAPINCFASFEAVSFPGATLYKKSARKKQTATPPQPEIALIAEPEPIRRDEEISVRTVAENPYELALKLYDEGCYAEAIEALSRSGPATTEAMKLLARAYANQGSLEQARAWCRKALTRAKLDPQLHYLLAVIYNEEGRAEDSIASLGRALYLDQDFVMAHFVLGSLSLRAEKRKQAARHFESALALLGSRADGELLPESEGITVGRLREIIQSVNREKGEL